MKKSSSGNINVQFQQAITLCQRNLITEAKVILQNLYEKHPANAGVLFALGTIEIQQNQLKAGVEKIQKSLKIDPSQPMALNNLGNALIELNENEKAIQSFDAAISINPKFVDAYYNLGRVYSKLEQFHLAVDYYQKVITLEERHIWAYVNKGYCLYKLKQHQLALVEYDKAVSLNESIPEIHNNRGLAYAALDQAEMAIKSFNRAIQLKSSYRTAYINLGSFLESIKEYEEATNSYKAALKFYPNDVEIMEFILEAYERMEIDEVKLSDFDKLLQIDPFNKSGLKAKGRYLESQGDFDGAIDAFKECLKHYPEDYINYFMISRLKKISLDDPLVDTMKKSLESIEAEDESRVYLLFALGKIYDDCKMWDEAYYSFFEARTCSSKNVGFQGAQAKYLDLIARKNFFGKSNIEIIKKQAISSEIPIFIIGMPRSGTTLTEQIISSHKEVLAAGEIRYWISDLQSYKKIDEIDFKRLGLNYIEWIKKAANFSHEKKHITDKMPYNFMNVGVLASLFPAAKFIHCKRDPLDNCWSIYTANLGEAHNYSVTQQALGNYYNAYRDLMSHWDELFPGRIFTIEYEKLVGDIDYWSRKMINFVGLEWDENCLSPHKNNRKVKTYSTWQVRQPVYTSSVKRSEPYKKHLKELIQILDNQP